MLHRWRAVHSCECFIAAAVPSVALSGRPFSSVRCAQLKKNNHHMIAGRFAGASGSGAGPGVHQGLTKTWSKRDMESVMRHLVCMGVLYEKVSKHETFGSISSVLKVRLALKRKHGQVQCSTLQYSFCSVLKVCLG